jgi:metal-responsive CopG/Arc/MetJ family transcriptional regulator
MKPKKPHLTLQIEPELLDRLDRYVERVKRDPERAGTSRGDIVRAAIVEFLKQHRA